MTKKKKENGTEFELTELYISLLKSPLKEVSETAAQDRCTWKIPKTGETDHAKEKNQSCDS
jgi:hypothetical protein